uniref:Kinesin motor domain-containing protein n=1 Tax=Mesocestoides corti TaxID=53468 RepID=A0A5K3EPL4_MESCO
MTGGQSEKDTNELQYIMSLVASVAYSDGRRLTHSFGLCLINKTLSVVHALFTFGLGCSINNVATSNGADILDSSSLSSSSMHGRQATNKRHIYIYISSDI